eukprot:1008974-Rhodomonas_salina.1
MMYCSFALVLAESCRIAAHLCPAPPSVTHNSAHTVRYKSTRRWVQVYPHRPVQVYPHRPVQVYPTLGIPTLSGTSVSTPLQVQVYPMLGTSVPRRQSPHVTARRPPSSTDTGTERQRQRQRQRETERHRETQTDTDTDTQSETDRDSDRHTDRDRDRHHTQHKAHRHSSTHRHTLSLSHTHTSWAQMPARRRLILAEESEESARHAVTATGLPATPSPI